MLDIFLEGVRASIEPCSLALVLPAIGATVLGGRRAWAAALGFWIAAAGLAWAQASILLDVGQGRTTGVVLGTFALAGLVLLWLARPRELIAMAVASDESPASGEATQNAIAAELRDRGVDAGPAATVTTWGQTTIPLAAGLLIGTAAGLLWQPCVGPELGTILTAAPREPENQLLPLAVYLAGVLLLTAVVSALPFLHDRVAAMFEAIPTSVLAVIPVLGLVVVLMTGQYEEIIGALVRASSL